MNILSMQTERFNLSNAYYLESQKILQSPHKNAIMSDLKKLLSFPVDKPMTPLERYIMRINNRPMDLNKDLINIRIPCDIYELTLILFEYYNCSLFKGSSTPHTRKQYMDSFNKNNKSVYDIISDESRYVWQNCLHSTLQLVAKEILDHIDLDSISSQLQTTKLEDVMDLEK